MATWVLTATGLPLTAPADTDLTGTIALTGAQPGDFPGSTITAVRLYRTLDVNAGADDHYEDQQAIRLEGSGGGLVAESVGSVVSRTSTGSWAYGAEITAGITAANMTATGNVLRSISTNGEYWAIFQANMKADGATTASITAVTVEIDYTPSVYVPNGDASGSWSVGGSASGTASVTLPYTQDFEAFSLGTALDDDPAFDAGFDVFCREQDGSKVMSPEPAATGAAWLGKNLTLDSTFSISFDLYMLAWPTALQYMVWHNSDADQPRLYLDNSPQGIYAQITTDAATALIPISLNTWYSVVWTYDGITNSLSVTPRAGGATTTETVADTIAVNMTEVRFGHRYGNLSDRYYIDNIRVDAEPIPEGTASGSWSADGAASGTMPSVAPKEGDASGSWSFAGSASGTAPLLPSLSGDASGGWTFTGAAAGQQPVIPINNGGASGSWSVTGTATGSTAMAGDASGSWSAGGSADGSAPVGSPAYSGTGTAITGTSSLATAGTPSYGTPVFHWNGTSAEPSSMYVYDGSTAQVATFREVPRGYLSVTEMLAQDTFYWAHRGGSAVVPEMSLYAYARAADQGFGGLEVSLARTSDGVWFGLHDQTLDRTSNVTGMDPETMTWAEVQEYRIILPQAYPQPHRPYMRIEEMVEAYGHTHVFIVDPKHALDKSDELFDYLLSVMPSDRIIAKYWGPSSTLADTVRPKNIQSWGYYYESTWDTDKANAGDWDMLGMQWDASQATWDDVISYGKPTVAHVCATRAAADTAIAKGADGIQTSGIFDVLTREIVTWPTE